MRLSTVPAGCSLFITHSNNWRGCYHYRSRGANTFACITAAAANPLPTSAPWLVMSAPRLAVVASVGNILW